MAAFLCIPASNVQPELAMRKQSDTSRYGTLDKAISLPFSRSKETTKAKVR
jgi:hypothetical protein